MGLFRSKRMAGQPVAAPTVALTPDPEHAVILHYALSDETHGTPEEREAIFALEDRLIALIDAAGVGDLDGNEFGGGEAVIYCYGPDASRLFQAIEAEARGFQARPAYAYLRFGTVTDAAAREERITF